MKIEDVVSNYKVYIMFAGAACIFILFIIVLVQAIKISKLNKKYNSFMRGNDGKSLEDTILVRFDDVDSLKEKVTTVSKRVEEIDEILLNTYQKIGIIKYDAFKEMGGKLSFALAMLDDTNNGFVLNSMHSSREGCYTYVKEIIHGESFIVLSEEEKLALKKAMSVKNFMQ